MKKIWPLITGLNLITAIVLLNVVLSFYPFLRIDLSQNKIYSLSEATKKIVRELDDIINIKVFLTADLPPEARPVAANLKTVLEECARLNPKRLKIEYKDPSKDEKVKEEAERAGISPLQFSSIKGDKFEMQNGYFGLTINYGAKQEVMPVAGDVGNLEYFLMSGIKKVSQKETPTVLLADGIGQQETKYLRKYLANDYLVEEVELKDEIKLNDKADSLMMIGQKTKLSDKILGVIKDWVAKKKGLIVFLDKISVNGQMAGEKIADTGLESILKDKGMEIENKLIVDKSAAIANFRTPNGAFITQYPYWLQIRPENIDRNSPVVSGINSLMIPWASPIKLDGNAKPLYTSSELSLTTDSFTDLSPMNKNNVISGETNKEVVGAINVDGAKVVLVADSDMIRDQFVANNEQNLTLALNLVDYFSQDPRLMLIRSKTLRNNSLIPVGDRIKMMIKAGTLSSPVLALLIIGAVSSLLRKKKNGEWQR